MIIQTIRMKSVTAEGMGTLSVFEAEHDVPFAIKRIYYIHDVPAGVQRGGHAHGKILIKLDDGFEKAEVLLDSPDKGLIVESNMWRDMLWQQDNSVLCVAADSFYDADDYIRDYEAFLRHVGAEDPAKE